MSKKKKIILLFGIFLVIMIGVGMTYAYYIATTSQQGENVVKTDCFKLTYNDDGQVVLNNAFPIRDNAVNNVTPYHFKVTNVCTLPASYQVNLEILNDSNLDISYLNYKLDNGSITSLNSATETTATIDGASSAKLLVTGNLDAEEEVEYDLRVWLKEAVTVDDPVQGKSFKSKISVISVLNKDLLNGNSAVDTIKRLAEGVDTSSTEVIGNTGLAYDGTADNNLRYVGANVNNYVSFNGQLWRIIGVMNNVQTASGKNSSLLKIISTQNMGNYSWDSSENSVNVGTGINQWGASGTYEGADLARELNNDYFGDIQVGTDGKWYSGLSNTKNANKINDTLTSISQSKIESVVWNLGSPTINNGEYDSNVESNLQPSSLYVREKSNTNGKLCSSGSYCNDNVVRTSTWTGKIALMYPSDYGYATSGGSTTSRNTCLNTTLNMWSSASVSDCKNNNWLLTSSGQWTLSPAANEDYADYAFFIEDSGCLNEERVANARGVRPVLYLKASVSITSGDGTEANPYLLK